MNSKKVGRQLSNVADALENHLADMCEFEFTIQDGELYVLGVRVGKRSAEAAVRIATDLFLEGRITGKTLVIRLSPVDVAEVLRPKLKLRSNLPRIGEGVPASGGASTGMVAFSCNSALRLAEAGNPVIFVKPEFSPEDVPGMYESAGIVSLQGGMTSHAAVIARGWRTPCVAGVGWSLDVPRNLLSTSKESIEEGEYITIDGTSGDIFSGRGEFHIPSGVQDERLLLLTQVIDVLASEGELPEGHVAAAWQIRDLITYGGSNANPPDREGIIQKWPHQYKVRRAKAFKNLNRRRTNALRDELYTLSESLDSNEYKYLWLGLRSCLLRQLSKYVGMGRHPNFYRPLFDPLEAILESGRSKKWDINPSDRIQLIGEEFFSINHYVPEYLEVEAIRIYWAIVCSRPQDLWRVDKTNPAGEKLLAGRSSILALKVIFNDASVSSEMLPRLYNYLRRKEYFWDWYSAKKTSRREIIELLRAHQETPRSKEDKALLRSAGLISASGQLNKAGISLLRPDSAKERVKRELQIGW
jgi:phosphohistidine swiveling domain-containing protein